MDQHKRYLNKAIEFLKTQPGFTMLTESAFTDLVNNGQIINLVPNEIIVKEGDVVDSFYMIIEGEAEVYTEVSKNNKTPVALLSSGNAIGLAASGLFSKTGERTASVIAKTNITLLKIDLRIFKTFLIRSENSELAKQFFSDLLRQDFLKKIAPFMHFTTNQIEWINQRIQEVSFAKDKIIFNQGEHGEHCYFIVSGNISIITDTEIARLGPLNYFGESSLLSDLPRNATAKALDDCFLLCLNKKDFLRLIESDKDIARFVYKSQIHRGRPAPVSGIYTFEQLKPDGAKFYILKNKIKGKYFQLSEQGWFVWNQMDGRKTLSDLTIKMYQELKIFDPHYISQLIISLQMSGFIFIPSAKTIPAKFPLWKRVFLWFSKLMQVSYAFKNNDTWLTKSYASIVKYLYSSWLLVSFTAIAIVGFFIFLLITPTTIATISNYNLFIYFGAALPFIYMSIILHELAHAYTVKYFGREVQNIGIGWFWISIVAFVDTSDMWTAKRMQRLIVNSAGIFTELVLAGIGIILSLFCESTLLQGIFWFYSFSMYISALLNFCPLFEFDGYYILMDILDKPNLRVSSISWLADLFSKPRQVSFKGHRAEIIYWICSLSYILLVASILHFIQSSIIKKFFPGNFFNLYLWLIPIVFLLVSIVSVIIKVKHIRDIFED